jgi:glycosyltransferase involved in cell wall biosynthesis
VTRPIVINARAAARPELGGVERWGREMAVRLPALRPGAYLLAAPRPRLVHRTGHAWEQVVLPALARRAHASLVFSPANLAPLAWPHNVVVIHDAAVLRRPDWYSRSYAAWQRTVLPRIARRAAHVLTVSEFSRREIVDLLGVEPERVSVIPGGVGEDFSPEADAEAAARAHGLARPYVLTVASRVARKNLAALEPAARALAAQGVELVAAGGDRPQFSAEDGVASVRDLGAVSEEHLPGLYAGARAFVLPSRYEGFGLTCLEAMASGTPVVASDRGALRETCDGAALLVDPDDEKGIAQAVGRAISDEPLREELRAAGLERAARLTWARSAQAVDDLLASLAGER